MVYSRDAQRALAFYRDLLGFRLVDEFRHEDKPVYARLRSPEGRWHSRVAWQTPGLPSSATAYGYTSKFGSSTTACLRSLFTNVHNRYGASNRSRTVLVSPVVVLVLGNAAARTSGHLWGVWSWIPVILVYWITLAGILGFAGGWTSFRRWLQPSQGAWGGVSCHSQRLRSSFWCFASTSARSINRGLSHFGLPLRLSILGLKRAIGGGCSWTLQADGPAG
jgi:hypothetical protein